MAVAIAIVTAAGAPLPAAFVVMSIEIVREVARVPYARLVLADGDLPRRRFPALDSDALAPGSEVAVSVRVGDATTPLFAGLVARLRLEAGAGAPPRLVVECKDRAWRLTRPRRSAVYAQMTDADATGAIVRRGGLTAGDIGGTDVVHPELVQYEASDWDFVAARAEACGLALTVRDGTLSTRRWSLDGSPKRAFELGLDAIDSLELELDASGQDADVEAVGWDLPAGAPTDPATATPLKLAQGNIDPADAAGKLGLGTATLSHMAPLKAGELRAWANGRLARERLEMLRGRLSVDGVDIDLLDLVGLASVGDRFGGKALVSGVRHTIAANAWSTDLQLGLAPPVAARAGAAGELLPAARGLRIGVVHAFEDDPDREQRIRVLLPGVGAGDGVVWARLATPEAGSGRGFLFRPMPGDEVVVGFFAEDPRQPVVLGALFGSRNAPPGPLAAASGKDVAKGFATTRGTGILVTDQDQPAIALTTKAASLRLDDATGSVTLSDGNGNTLAMGRDGITLTSKKAITLDAGTSGDVTVKGGGIALN